MNNPEVYNSPKGKAPFLECNFFQFKHTPSKNAKKTNFGISPEKTKENIKENIKEIANENTKLISCIFPENVKKKEFFRQKKLPEEKKSKERSESCEKINNLRKHRFSTVVIDKEREIKEKSLRKFPFMETIDTMQSLAIFELKHEDNIEDCKGNRSEKLRSNMQGSANEFEKDKKELHREKSENLNEI